MCHQNPSTTFWNILHTVKTSIYPLGPYSVQTVGAAWAVSWAIGHNPGRVATPTQDTSVLALILSTLEGWQAESTPPGIDSTAEWDLKSGSYDPKPATLTIMPTRGITDKQKGVKTQPPSPSVAEVMMWYVRASILCHVNFFFLGSCYFYFVPTVQGSGLPKYAVSFFVSVKCTLRRTGCNCNVEFKTAIQVKEDIDWWLLIKSTDLSNNIVQLNKKETFLQPQ